MSPIAWVTLPARRWAHGRWAHGHWAHGHWAHGHWAHGHSAHLRHTPRHGGLP